MWCKLSDASSVVHAVQLNVVYARCYNHVRQSMWCELCDAPYVVHSVWFELRGSSVPSTRCKLYGKSARSPNIAVSVWGAHEAPTARHR
eukprot:8893145-Pyramimonas_sp.AAC.1